MWGPVCDRDRSREPQRPHSTLHTPHTVASALAQRASASSMEVCGAVPGAGRGALFVSTSRNPDCGLPRHRERESESMYVCAVLREWRERDTNNSQHTRREVQLQVRSVMSLRLCETLTLLSRLSERVCMYATYTLVRRTVARTHGHAGWESVQPKLKLSPHGSRQSTAACWRPGSRGARS